MKHTIEHILEILLELMPMLAFVVILLALTLGGQMSAWLDNISIWMFGG